MLINLFVKIFLVNYYCDMERELIDIKNGQVFLQDNSSYFYTIKPFEITNILGKVISVLDEYIFVSTEQKNETELYKIYRTREGNWYDIAELKSAVENTILRALKSVMERK